MKLICYLQERETLDLRPANIARDWMDDSISRFAYRCLPLNIANSHGWEICCETEFEAQWNGGSSKTDIEVSSNERGAAITHFGSGVLTFHVSCVFRTDPGWNLMVMGPPNRPKRGIHALSGVIETDWSPYSFTMNWMFTEPHHKIKFEKGEPFCFFFPITRGSIETTEPVFRDMRDDELLYQQHIEWCESRRKFNQELTQPDSQARQDKWQRNYFHGQLLDGQLGSEDHQTKVRAKAFCPHKK